MATKLKAVNIRETKENVFNTLKAVAPGIFGSYVWTDVESFGDDPSDTSKFMVVFNEESDT